MAVTDGDATCSTGSWVERLLVGGAVCTGCPELVAWVSSSCTRVASGDEVRYRDSDLLVDEFVNHWCVPTQPPGCQGVPGESVDFSMTPDFFL